MARSLNEVPLHTQFFHMERFARRRRSLHFEQFFFLMLVPYCKEHVVYFMFVSLLPVLKNRFGNELPSITINCFRFSYEVLAWLRKVGDLLQTIQILPKKPSKNFDISFKTLVQKSLPIIEI